jgi:hypothetical protein
VLFGTTRQNALAANQWMNNHSGIAKPDYTTYQYAGAIGGKVPFTDKFRFLKDTFFWATEEGYRQAQPLVSSNTSLFLPTKEEREGNFSLDTGTIYDPRTFSGGARTALAGNLIPSGLINPIGQYIANQFPLPNQPVTKYTNGAANFVGSADFKTRGDEYVGKLDHQFAPWWQASASYVHLATQEPHGNVYHTDNASDAILTRYIDATAVHNTFIINPTTLLTAGYGYSRYYSTSPQYSNGFDQHTGFGGTGFPSAYVDQLQSKTFPTISLTGVTNAGTLGYYNTGPTIQAQHSFVTTLSKTIGKHNLKVGYVFRDFHKFVASQASGNGSFTFNGQYADSNGTPVTNGPQAIADLLFGLPSSASVTINALAIDQFLHYQALFAQDDIRLSDKLTANVGLRYEYEPGQQESSNQYNVGFDPTLQSTYTGSDSSGNPDTVTVNGGIAFAGQNGYPVHSGDLSHTKFSPRVGVSYEVRPGTVVRAGFGVFYAGIPLSSASTGFSQTTSYAPGNITAAIPSGATGANAWLSNPFNATLLQPSGASLKGLTGLGSAITVPSTHLGYPLVEQYSADIERQFPGNIVIKIGYAGAHGRNLPDAVNINQISDSVLAQYAPGGIHAGTDLSTKVTNPYYAATVGGYPSTGTIAQKKVPLGQTLLPFPQFSSITETKSVGHSQYNALDVKVQKRFNHGLTALVTYTWASNWDNLWGSPVSGLNQTNPNAASPNAAPQDNYNPNGEYSRATNDTPNRLTFAVTYELPVGRGKPILGNANRLLDAIVGGWKINDVTTLQNGGPQPVIQTDLSTTYGTTGIGGFNQRPNLVPGVDPCYSGSPSSRLGGPSKVAGVANKQYFNLSAFTPALAYTYGNAPRTLACKGPGYSNSDISINKNFKIRDKVNFEFRAEALNAFNKPEFSQAGTTLTFANKSLTSATYTPPASNTTTGAITSQLGFSRIIQVGGRLSF